LEDSQGKLIAKAKKGDKDAFEKLYSDNLKWIVYQVSNQLYDQTMIEDATQDVAVKMWNSLKGLKSDEAFKVWLYRIIQNLCKTQNLKYQRVRYDSDLDTQENILKEGDTSSVPENAMASKNDNEMLVALMQELSDLQRQTLLLFYYDGMKYREIADALGVSTSTVSTNIIVAKRNLKKMFEQNGITSIYIDDEPGEAEKPTEKPINLGAAIAMTSAASAESVFASVNVPGILTGVHAKLATVGTISKAGFLAKASMSKVGQAATLKVAAIVVSASLVTVGGVGGYVIANDGVLFGSKEAVVAAVDHEFDISIVFVQGVGPASSAGTGEDGDADVLGEDDVDVVLAEHVNPVGADLIIGDERDLPGAWQIDTVDGTTISKGNGSHIDASVFATLTVGDYVLTWHVSGFDGSSAKAEREFEIR
jgi:RNA polymerase sigma factor (sigma-70 family)